MKFRPALLPALVCALSLLVGGCVADSSSTNEPSVAEIDKANQSRAAAIDNDPNMTQAQKDEMKKHLSLGKYGGGNQASNSGK